MKMYRLLSFALVAISLAAATRASAQTRPAASGPYQNLYPLTIGGGISNFNVDWDKSRMQGVTAWAEWRFTFLPKPVNGLGLEVEGRDINYGRPATVPANFRQDTLLFGPMFTFAQVRYFQPYLKALEGFGSLDTYVPAHGKVAAVHHETQVVGAPGLGVQFNMRRHIFGRVEYEYQAWPNALGNGIQPQGFTAGMTYEFRGIRR
ncbi:MAG TPA: outer membrane beta-barrel protein [Terracidiphilus sp.]|nr:outer membrane beta-barrel protein [Terracidiphilus sp.]